MDVDYLGNIMMGIASSDPVYNLDTPSRTSTVLIHVQVPSQGTYIVAWSKIIDLATPSTTQTFPIHGSFSENGNGYALAVASDVQQDNLSFLFINSTTGDLLQAYKLQTPGQVKVNSIFMSGSISY